MGEHSLQQAAADAIKKLRRFAGTGDGSSILEQIENGTWDVPLSPAQSKDLADRLHAVAEHVRYTRAWVPDELTVPVDVERDPRPERLRLPLNRKERYYTGTVLPMLVASDGFAYLDRLLRLCGLEADLDVPARLDGGLDIDFYTEYSHAESVFTDEDRGAWPVPPGGDTPDVVINGGDWLLAIEAKMFHNPNAADLAAQMRRQRVLVDLWTERMGLDPARVRHVLLLPRPLADRVQGTLPVELVDAVVTWEEVLEQYWTVAPRHWSRVLHHALTRHGALESSRELNFRANAQQVMTGADIAAGAADRHDPPLDYIGRSGGLNGALFAEDVATGRWRTTKYELRSGPPANPSNRNWFTLTEFNTRIGAPQAAPPEPSDTGTVS
jgi:hypothetical protein